MGYCVRFMKYHFTFSSGPEDYDRLRPLSYPQTDIFVVLFSVAAPSSFYNIPIKWVPEMKKYCPDTPILLVGSKIDLRENYPVLNKLHSKGQTCITKEEGIAMAKASACIGYTEISSIRGQGLKELFELALCCPNAYMDKEKKKRCRTQ